MTDILWEYTYRVVPNIKDSNYESNAQPLLLYAK